MKENTVIIIGAGFAGLSAGIYAQINGYKTQIFEMHNLPGGLCTSWKRNGFTIDGCIHWLVGSSPSSAMHSMWEETGIAQGREFIYMDEYMRYESNDGRTLVFYTDTDKLEKHLLEFSPQDEVPIREFIKGIRMCQAFDLPSSDAPFLKRASTAIKLGSTILLKGPAMRRWMKTTAAGFAERFKDPVLRSAILEMWFPDFSMFFMLFTFAWLNSRNAGYPVGGSLPMSEAMAKRYIDLGGKIHYDSAVQKILVEGNKAIGIRTKEGTEHHAGMIISAADGYSTIFNMLEGRYVDDATRKPYEKWPVFPPLIYVGLGVNRSFNDEPQTVSGISIQLPEPVIIGDLERNRLWVHIYNQDPTLAPAGKTSLVVMMATNYEYWKELSTDKAAYKAAKEEVGDRVIELLEKRFPGISRQVEMVDVATPLTFERYTGNWKGSFEGWLITPENSYTLMKRMPQTLPGLDSFYLCGQWVEPGGGLPSGVMSAKRLMKTICKKDGIKFKCHV